MEYYKNKIQELINNNVSMEELNDLFEQIALDDDITNKEYTDLLIKAQNNYKI